MGEWPIPPLTRDLTVAALRFRYRLPHPDIQGLTCMHPHDTRCSYRCMVRSDHSWQSVRNWWVNPPAEEWRGFSGHWMAFCCACHAVFCRSNQGYKPALCQRPLGITQRDLLHAVRSTCRKSSLGSETFAEWQPHDSRRNRSLKFQGLCPNGELMASFFCNFEQN
jgi:hypothetical protein